MADPKLQLLKSVPLFAQLGGRDLEAVARLADTIDLPAGKVIMRQGQPGHEAFVLSSGSVLVERNGREIARLGAGAVVGEMSLLSQSARMATVTTLEPTSAFVLAHREFNSLMDGSPAVRQCVFDELARRIRILDTTAD